ncbi:MAG: hypothetical protein GY861_24985 [bacterium]|nr:hypothetical protein [bacterium]
MHVELADKGMVIDKNPLAEYRTDDQFQGEIEIVNIMKHPVRLVTKNNYTSIKVKEWYDSQMDGKNVYLTDNDLYKILCFHGIETIFAANDTELPEYIG